MLPHVRKVQPVDARKCYKLCLKLYVFMNGNGLS